ncbi:MAG: alkaline phosphatase D family protein, partial [Bacteroidia bacterium]
TFKVICMGGQILNPAKVKENYSNYSRERDSLFNIIGQENIKGIVFLSGDRHFTELTKLERNGTYPFYDFTISPLTSGVHKGAEKEANTMRVDGTLVQQQNFAVGKLTGKGQERTLTITVYDIDGKELWSRSIAAKELK